MRCAKCRVDADCNSQKQCLPRRRRRSISRSCNSSADCVEDGRRYCLASQCRPTCYIYDGRTIHGLNPAPRKCDVSQYLKMGTKIRDSGYSGTDTRFIGRCTPTSLSRRQGWSKHNARDCCAVSTLRKG